MLGKTNITTLSESAIVTEIEDYSWIKMQSGVFGNFVKAIYKNGYLVGITADGTIVYTTDGEAWQTHVLEYEDCKLNDIDWDGSRFILVGSYTGESPLEIEAGKIVKRGLIAVTSDLTAFEMKSIEADDRYFTECFLIYPTNGKYIIIAEKEYKSGSSKYTWKNIWIGNMEKKWEEKGYYNFQTHSIAKNSKGLIAVGGRIISNSVSTYEVQRIDGNTGDLFNYSRSNVNNIIFFECKDELYSICFTGNYDLYKITNSDEYMTMSSGENFAFVDGIYFNECQIFINAREMLIVKKGESIADKTLDDLIEVAPEFTMNCITKAFGQLYIFGNQGLILKSSVETNNEEVLTVQTISAKKALFDAKKYTDERYTILEERIAALERGGPDENI